MDFRKDKGFVSSFWRHLSSLHGTMLNMSSSYHPQSDGQSEILNKCLEMYLRCFVFYCPPRWLDYLPWAEFSYNTAFHTAIGMTPFKVIYGRDRPSILPANITVDVPSDLASQLQYRDQLLEQLKHNLLKAQTRMKKQADQRRTEVHFDVGDFVFVKLQPYRQHTVALRKHHKLALKYFGPFPIVHKIGSVAYRLQLPEHARIHPVFHVSLLKRYEGLATTPYVPLPLVTESEGPILQPIEVLDYRVVKKNAYWVSQILVRWDALEDPTLEFVSEMQRLYPSFDLGDKVSLGQRSNVMNNEVDPNGLGCALNKWGNNRGNGPS